MATVTALLDQLAAGELTVDEVAADFRTRTWPAVDRATWDEAQLGVEADAPGPDSWDAVNADFRVTPETYTRLAAAYQEALRG